MSPKLKQYLINLLRKGSYRWKPRNLAKKKMQRAPATYECECCGVWIYSGKSDYNYEAIVEQFPDKTILKDKIYLDHIEPVIDPIDGWIDLDEYAKRMFCEAEGFQCLCFGCHDMKTRFENLLRKDP